MSNPSGIENEDALRDFYNAHSDEYHKFENVKEKCCTRPDLNAFMLLHDLIPGTEHIIGGSEHDEFYINIEVSDLLKVATEEQLLDLYRCGVRVGEYGLEMFS